MAIKLRVEIGATYDVEGLNPNIIQSHNNLMLD